MLNCYNYSADSSGLTSTSSLTVTWTPPSDTSNVGSYMFTVTGENCGCESMNISADTTSVSCSGWTARGQTCSFEVRTISQDCGFNSDSVAQAISLRGEFHPGSYIIIMSDRFHSTIQSNRATSDGNVQSVRNQYGSTDYVEIYFMGVVSSAFSNKFYNSHILQSTPLLGANLDSKSISYTVTLTGNRASLQFNGVNCNTTNYCTVRVNRSQLFPIDRYTVSVVASNIFGQGAPAILEYQG